MRSSLFLVIVDIIMQDLEEIAIGRLFVQLFYFRYVDDIILALESINDILISF